MQSCNHTSGPVDHRLSCRQSGSGNLSKKRKAQPQDTAVSSQGEGSGQDKGKPLNTYSKRARSAAAAAAAAAVSQIRGQRRLLLASMRCVSVSAQGNCRSVLMCVTLCHNHKSPMSRTRATSSSRSSLMVCCNFCLENLLVLMLMHCRCTSADLIWR